MVSTKRSMEWRISQRFCLLIRQRQFREALEFGSEHIDFIRRDGWGARGGGMVSTALFVVCETDLDEKDEKAANDRSLTSLLQLILTTMGGSDTVNHALVGVRDGLTPLVAAVRLCRATTVTALLCRHDIDPCAPDASGRSPVVAAIQTQHPAVVQLFLTPDMLPRIVLDEKLPVPREPALYQTVQEAKRVWHVMRHSLLLEWFLTRVKDWPRVLVVLVESYLPMDTTTS